MESSSSPATPCMLHSQFMGHIQAGTASESKALEAWKSGAAPHGFKQGCRNALLSESRTCPDVTGAFVLPADGLCSQSEVFLDCEDAALDSLLPSCGQPDSLDVNESETCQKKFMMFDHSGDNKQMIFFPAMTHDCSSLLQCGLNCQRDYLEHLQIKSVAAIDQRKETTVGLNRGDITAGESGLLYPRNYANIIKEENGFFCPRKDLQLCSGIFPGMMCERLHSVIFMRGEVPFSQSSPPTGAEAFCEGISNDVKLDFQMLSHEDTDDLEALLSSDDELSSTGHSPSDVLTNNFPNGYSKDGSSLNSGKKRKGEVINLCSDDDAESSPATSAFIELACLKDSYSDVFHTVSGSMDSAIFKQCRDKGSRKELAPFAVKFPDEISCRNESGEHRAVYKKPSLEKQGPAKRARKKKIRQTFQLLRNIIPGGDFMDAAIVLDEAIQYVKSLQVKVQSLEAKKST